MKVYGFPNTRSARVVWTLEEAGASYDYILVNLLKGEARQPQFLGVNPAGKVPAFSDGQLVLTESGAICTHIADKSPASKLAPPFGSDDRARFHQWCLFALTELEQPMWTLSKHQFALPEKMRVPAILDTARWEFARAAKIFAQGLGTREFIVGDSLTVADILLANTLEWARRRSVEIEHPGLIAYADRLLARPAQLRAVARENAAAEATKA